MKHFLKKTFALLLCLVMLVSCWVFTAPTAQAGQRDGKYKIRVYLEIQKNDTVNTATYVKVSWGGQKHTVWSAAQENYTSFECYQGEIDSFPTGMESNLSYWGWFANGKWTVHLSIWNYNTNDWEDLCTIHQEELGNADHVASATVEASKFPVASSLKFTKKPATTITVPRNDEPIFVSEYETEIYDQYGMLLQEEATVSFTNYHAGVNAAGGEVSVSSDANSDDGSDTKLTLVASYLTMTETVEITLKNATYTYQFLDTDDTVLKSGSLKAGEEITAPDYTPVKDYDNTYHYVFDGWSSAVGQIKKDTTFRPVFQSVKHGLDTYVSNGDATCLEDGTKTATCPDCGYRKTVADVGSAQGHDYQSAVTVPVTCTEDGEITYTCSRCNDSYKEVVEAQGHNYLTSRVLPTCTEQGYVLHTCNKCGDFYKTNYSSPLGHDWDGGIVDTDATCTQKGEKIFSCSRCGTQKTEDIPALGHAYGEWKTEILPSCTEEGLKYSICTRENCKERVEEVIPASGHDWSNWTTTTKAKCETDGEKSRFCNTCASIETQVITATGHNFDRANPTIDQPTDGKTGRVYYKCKNGCGKCAIYTVDAEGHAAIGDVITETDLQSSEENVIPTTSFNTFKRTQIGYDYSLHGASLRVDKNLPADVQPIRFAASMTVPEGVTIKDFGFVSTIDESIAGKVKKFVIGKDGVAQLSVKGGKYSTFHTDGGDVITFNGVYELKNDANNIKWTTTYFVKPYIIYEYMGMEFTVYDSGFSEHSVYEIAQKVVASKNEPKYIKDYVQSKILDVINAG